MMKLHHSTGIVSTTARRIVALAVLTATFTGLSLTGPAIDSAANAQEPKMVTEVEGIAEYRLDNGVKLLLFPDNSKPQFTINVTVLAGSRHEGYGETGMAHLLEHMLFKGTDRHPDIPALLKERGVLNMNGTTWVDRTNYYETLPSTGDNLEFAIDMESDRLVNSWINGDDLTSEMTVVRNEFERGENSPQRVLYQRMMAGAYEWHNYGKSTIGNRTDIERVQIPNLRAFYQKFYQPDNIMVVLAGDFDTENALELIEKYFGALPVPDRELPKTYTEEPVQDGERVVKLRRVGDYQVVGVGYHIPAAGDPTYPAFEVLASILSNQPEGPLYQSMVVKKLASSISADSMATHDPGMLMATADVNKEGDIEAAREALILTIEGIGTDGVQDADVKRAIAKLMKSREQSFANTERFAINLSEWEAYGDWRLFFLHRDRLEKVTANDVKAAAATYLVEDNRTVGMFLPTENPVRAPMPSQHNLGTVLADYKGRDKIAAGEAFDPTPDNIDQRTVTGELESGAKYAFLPKKTRGERVFLQANMHYGDDENLKGLDTATSMLPQLLTRGTESYGFQEFSDKLNDLKASMSFGGSTGELTINIQAKRETLNDVLDLLKSALREPTLSADELDIVRDQQLTQIESMKSDPQMIAFTEFMRGLAPHDKDDVRYSPTIEENIQRIKDVNIDEVKKIYSEFLSGNNVEIAIVGDFDPEPAKKKLEDIFANWKSDMNYARIEEPANLQVKGERITVNTPDKKNAVYIAGVNSPIRDDSPEYEAMLVGNYIMGGGPLSSRLADRIRKKDGLSYTAMSRFQADSEDDRGLYMMFMISNPSNTEKVVEAAEEEVDRMLESGVTGEELEKAKDSYLQNRQGGRANDNQLVGTLVDNLRLERTMEFAQQSDEKIEVLSKDQVDNALKKMIDKSRMLIITAGDFESVEAAEENSDSEEADSEDSESEKEPATAGSDK